MNLQGIKTDGEKLKAAEWKNEVYLELLGLQLGAQTPKAGGGSIIASLSRQDLRGAQHLCSYLEGQENGGQTLDEIFKDARNFEQAARQLSIIGQLMAELDAIPFEKRFAGLQEARSMLASLSVQLKQVARIAANRRPGKIRNFR